MGFILISQADPPFQATSRCPDKVDVALGPNVQCKQIKLRRKDRWTDQVIILMRNWMLQPH